MTLNWGIHRVFSYMLVWKLCYTRWEGAGTGENGGMNGGKPESANKQGIHGHGQGKNV